MDAYFLTIENLTTPTDDDLDEALTISRPTMVAIADRLVAAGAVLAQPVEQWESYGWSFAIREGDAHIHCMLQWGGEWLLMCWAHRTLGDRLRGRRFTQELERARDRIAAAVSAELNVPKPVWRAEA